MDFKSLGTFWIPFFVVIVLIVFLIRTYFSSDKFKYRKQIAKSYQEAKDCDGFWYGKQGSEFDDPEIRKAIIKRDGCKCKKCGRKVHIGSPKTFGQRVKKLFGLWHQLVIDHIIPFIYGGLGIITNGRVLCWNCNSRRKAKIDRDCLEKVKEYGKKIYSGKRVPKFEYKRNRMKGIENEE